MWQIFGLNSDILFCWENLLFSCILCTIMIGRLVFFFLVIFIVLLGLFLWAISISFLQWGTILAYFFFPFPLPLNNVLINFSQVFAFDLPMGDVFSLLGGNWWANVLIFFPLSSPIFVSSSFCLVKANILLYHYNSLFCFSLHSLLNIFNLCHPSFGCGFSSIQLVNS